MPPNKPYVLAFWGTYRHSGEELIVEDNLLSLQVIENKSRRNPSERCEESGSYQGGADDLGLLSWQMVSWGKCAGRVQRRQDRSLAWPASLLLRD